jgi:hypothetical protein
VKKVLGVRNLFFINRFGGLVIGVGEDVGPVSFQLFLFAIGADPAKRDRTGIEFPA